ncbi:MAG: recombination protein RecR [Bacteroidales bacterium]|nr:recombination protein RecR [Bacteroidales bacterium]MBO7764581.1 recombination protein RecR [Bacteroidales bacterium]MBQ2243878.1 recombination protein RecR [Bacteroidales bacterium]
MGNRLLQDAVEQLSSLPGIGKKSALRFALYLLKQPMENVERFGNSIISLRREIKYCTECNMISDSNMCPICADARRDRRTICVVESLRDVLSIEATGEYRGVYHVLGGVISPMDGVGPADLPIDQLCRRVQDNQIEEVILALSTGMEGETTSFYLYKVLTPLNVKITAIARGVAFGDDLEYTDQLTLGRSIVNRQIFSPEI